MTKKLCPHDYFFAHDNVRKVLHQILKLNKELANYSCLSERCQRSYVPTTNLFNVKDPCKQETRKYTHTAKSEGETLIIVLSTLLYKNYIGILAPSTATLCLFLIRDSGRKDFICTVYNHLPQKLEQTKHHHHNYSACPCGMHREGGKHQVEHTVVFVRRCHRSL